MTGPSPGTIVCPGSGKNVYGWENLSPVATLPGSIYLLT
jgi:hypothetical protein